MKIIMDTHVHSNASDGSLKPSEVVDLAKSLGLEVIALTDHDTVAGVQEAIDRGKEIWLRVIRGTEIDAKYRSGKLLVDNEILGLDIDLGSIRPFTEERTMARRKSFENYVSALNSYIGSQDFNERNEEMRYKLGNVQPLSVSEIVSWLNEKNKYENPQPFLSKWTLLKYMLEKFVILPEDINEIAMKSNFFQEEFRKEYSFLFKGELEKPSMYEAIKAVKNAGGKAILAHPGFSKAYEGGMVKEWRRPKKEWFLASSKELTPFEFVKDLVDHGLDGVEIYYYVGNDERHAIMQDRINMYFKEMAEKLKIMTTYGSDFHGPKNGDVVMGKFGSEKIYL
jgi:hypothetical protein